MLKLVTALLLSVVSLAAQASLGEFLYTTNRSAEAWLAGLEEKTRQVDGVTWHYYVRDAGKGDCIVLVHGFTAEAGNWFRFARHMPKDRCLIVPDLPGFGQSPYRADIGYLIPQQASRLQAFVNAVSPSGKLHLAGSSMGGHIVLTYALQDQKRVASLALFDAAGVVSPMKSDLTLQIEKTGRNPFDVRRPEDFTAFLPMTMHDIPWMPGLVKDHLADEFVERNARYQSIFKTIFGKDMWNERLHEIKVPTLVIWGAKDRLLHVAMADVFHKGIAGSKKVIYPDLGHLPFLEAPSRSADDYLMFLDGILTQAK